MDNLTHTLAGVAMARAGLSSKYGAGTTVLLAGGVQPAGHRRPRHVRRRARPSRHPAHGDALRDRRAAARGGAGGHRANVDARRLLPGALWDVAARLLHPRGLGPRELLRGGGPLSLQPRTL